MRSQFSTDLLPAVAHPTRPSFAPFPPITKIFLNRGHLLCEKIDYVLYLLSSLLNILRTFKVLGQS